MTEIKRDYHEETLMLLGSYDRLVDRRRISHELSTLGYKYIIIMEDSDWKRTDRGLDGKFRRIVCESNPFFFAIFHNEAKMDGVAFELGWLCGVLTTSQLSRRLRIVHEVGYNWSETTGYVPALFSDVPNMWFNENEDYLKISTYIDNCVKFRS